MRYLLFAFLAVGYFTLHAQSFPIGTQTVTYQDPARSNRNVQTYLYYPATSAGNGTPLATGTFPVVVIGHGFAMNYAPYVVYADSLTPKGYIVAIVNTETGFSPSHATYGLDLAFIVAQLYAENTNAASPFFQHVTLSACMMGHSMGGGCTILGASGNPNVTCTATFALAETTPSAIAAATMLTAPSLVFSGSEDCVAPAAAHQTPVYNNLPGCKSFVSITGGGHCNFATSNFNCNFGEFTCNPGGPTLGAVAHRAIVFQLLTTWLDRFLKGNVAAGPVYAAQLATLATQNSITFINPCAALPLPVEIVRFDVSGQRDQVQLRWETGTEKNVGQFIIEKSHNGIDFMPIGSHAPQGSGSTYSMTDQQPFTGVNYYRIAIADTDGTMAYSQVQSIHFQHHSSFTLAPNPSTGAFDLQTGGEGDEPVQLRVFDSQGRVMEVSATNSGNGLYHVVFPEHTPAGWYGCQWTTYNGSTHTGVVVLQR